MKTLFNHKQASQDEIDSFVDQITYMYYYVNIYFHQMGASWLKDDYVEIEVHDRIGDNNFFEEFIMSNHVTRKIFSNFIESRLKYIFVNFGPERIFHVKRVLRFQGESLLSSNICTFSGHKLSSKDFMEKKIRSISVELMKDIEYAN